MARSGKTSKLITQPDPVYGNRLVTKLVNQVMRDGKKSVAQAQVYQAFDIIKSNLKDEDPLQVFRQALENIKPQMEVRSRRVGGAAYQVPMPVKGSRKESLAIRWLIGFSRKRSNKLFHTFADKLAAEIIEAYNNEGEAVKRKETTHKMAEANKAFAHFRW
jgi:small subunit ribosomal protein S7